jgi:hypothetical protein
MTKHIIRNVLLACLALALPLGCGGDTKKQDPKAAKAEKKADKKAEPDLAETEKKPVEDEGPKPSMDTPEGRVTLAALVASEIAQAPDKADEILESNGLDRDKLDALMYEIARDPELSKAYVGGPGRLRARRGRSRQDSPGPWSGSRVLRSPLQPTRWVADKRVPACPCPISSTRSRRSASSAFARESARRSRCCSSSVDCCSWHRPAGASR